MPAGRRHIEPTGFSWNNATYVSSVSDWTSRQCSPSFLRCASQNDAHRALLATSVTIGSKIRCPYQFTMCSVLRNCVKAATNKAADLFFSGTHQASLENTSITVSMNVVPSLTFFNRDMSTRSACHCWFGPPTTTQRRLKRCLTGLWSVYVSCSDNQRSTSCSGTTLRRAATPP